MSGMTGGDITTLTGNAGGLIPSSGSGNFNIVGSGAITVTGTPATHTLTISGSGVPVITNHALVVGTGVTIAGIALGLTGQILTGVTGADPAWTTATYPSTVAKGDVLVASATNVIGVVNDVVNAGYVLTANAAAAPTFQALPAGVTYASDPETIAGTVTNKAVAPSNLKAKLGLQTVHALPVGNSDSLALDWLAVGGDGTVLIGNAGADPSFSANPTVTTIYATTFDTNVVAAAVTLSGTTLAADGTDANIDLTVTPKGTGDLVLSTGDVSVTSGNLLLPATTASIGQIKINSSIVLANSSDGTLTNIAVGTGATCPAGGGITAVGYEAGFSQAGLTAIGYRAGFTAASNSQFATWIGANTGGKGGKYSTYIGYNSGSAVTVNNGHNLYINNDGGGGSEQCTIRIGRDNGFGENSQADCYVAGIYTVYTAAPATAKVTLIGSNSRVFGLAGTAGQVLQGGVKPVFSTTTYPSTAAIGDVLVASAANTIGVVTGAATAGHVLMANGAGSAPTFQALPASIASVAGTANQITASTVGGAVTLSTPATFIAPGTIASTTTNTAGTDLISTAGNLKLPTTSSIVGQIQWNSIPYIHAYGGDGLEGIYDSNIFLGKYAGNFTMTTGANFGGNVGVGYKALNAVVSSGSNLALGTKALTLLQGSPGTSGNSNVALGNLAGSRLIGNSGVNFGAYFNLLIGSNAGYNLTASEYSNIYLNSDGTAGENGYLRIGSGTAANDAAVLATRKIQKAFISGIYGKTPAGTLNVALIDSNDQLGSVASLPPSLGGAMTWTEVTGTSQAAAVGNGYITNNVALVTVTLPASSAIGTEFKIQGASVGLYRIAQNAGQTIHLGATNTTTGVGGYVESLNTYDSIGLVCITADTDWAVTSCVGNFTIV